MPRTWRGTRRSSASFPSATTSREGGKLTPAWQSLFARYPERFVIGSDTWVNARWAQYGEIMDWYRGWLALLPADIARRIAFANAAGLFAAAPR